MENFDEMSKGFDTDRRIRRAEIIADKIRRHIIADKSKYAIEYGCGTGLIGFKLADDFKSLLFVDSSRGMISQVEQKIKDLGNTNASALCCDLMEHTTKELRADYIFSSLVLHHIIDTEHALSRFYETLSDDGHLLIVDVDEEDGSFHAKYPDFDGHNGFNHDILINLALKAGFKAATAKTFFHDSKIFNGKENPYSLFILDAAK